MWWSCFSYDKKGPYNIWSLEIKAEKEAYKKDLDAQNVAQYEEDRRKWELEYGLQRIHITRNQAGPQAQFRHTEDTRAYVLNEGKGGIN